MTSLEKKELLEELRKEVLEEVYKELFSPKTVLVDVCRKNIPEPSYKKLGDAGMDVVAAEDFTIMPGETVKIPTGLIVGIPWGHEIQVRPRGGNSLNSPLRVANAPGTVDWGFRDEVCVIMTNSSSRLYYSYTGELEEMGSTLPVYGIDDEGNHPGIYKINKGDRIAQIVLARFEEMIIQRVEPGFIKTLGFDRGGGFGSTGTR